MTADPVAILRAAEADALADLRWARKRLAQIREALEAHGEVPSDLLPPGERLPRSAPHPPNPEALRKVMVTAGERRAAKAQPPKPEPPATAEPIRFSPQQRPTARLVPSGVKSKPDYASARTAALSDVAEWEA